MTLQRLKLSKKSLVSFRFTAWHFFPLNDLQFDAEYEGEKLEEASPPLPEEVGDTVPVGPMDNVTINGKNQRT